MFETNQKNQENGFRSGVASSETVRASAHRRSSYSLFGCVPAEPNSASLDKIIVPNQIIKLRLEFLRGIYPAYGARIPKVGILSEIWILATI